MEMQKEAQVHVDGLTEVELQELKVRSQVSASGSIRASSHTSSHSSRKSTILATAKAKVQAARTRTAYCQREIEIKLQKAKLEAELEAMQAEKEMEAAIVEAAALQAELDVDQNLGEPGSEVNQRYCTAYDVLKQAVKLESDIAMPNQQSNSSPQTQQQRQAVLLAKRYHEPPQTNSKAWQGAKDNAQHSPLPPASPPYHHALDRDNHDSATTDLARFITRNQLISTGLTKFDDRAENYWAWKASFCNAIDNIGLTLAEETDLLIKWLGKESSEQARRLKAAYIRDPEGGIRAIWQRLEECYGIPEAIEKALFARLENFPKISNREPAKLRELADLLQELSAAKQDGFLPGLAYLDTARGVAPVVDKLPYNLQEKWMFYGSQVKQEHDIPFPPFSVFVDFIHRQAKARNDPSFTISPTTAKKDKPKNYPGYTNQPVSVHKMQVAESSNTSEPKVDAADPSRYCPIHKKPHPLGKCRSFRDKLLPDRKQYLKDNSICFRCCASTAHIAKNCNTVITCAECKSDKHTEALHPGPSPWKAKPHSPTSDNGREGEDSQPSQEAVSSSCTEVCGNGVSARACSKICLVKVYPQGHRESATKVYAIIDEQSNKSLARSDFFEIFNNKSPPSPYTLKTCAGSTQTFGRRACGYMIESLDEKMCIPLPVLIECNELPNNRSEIPTPNAAFYHPHLKGIANEIPPLDPKAEILLLLGRDILRIHKIRKQINGPSNAPFAQKLDLGWVVIGDVCLGTAHRPSSVNAFKTYILENGRPSYLPPCRSHLHVKDPTQSYSSLHFPLPQRPATQTASPSCGDKTSLSVFACTDKDNMLAPSIENLKFIKIMDTEVFKDDTQRWVAPLPFRSPRRQLPNNRDYSMKRLKSVCHTLEKKPEMKEHDIQFMQNMIDREHAELAPVLQEGKECWYLPSFGIYHPKKPDQIRIVFDSSAQYEGISLNSVLLKGPDLNNNLLGILIRFRKEKIAVTADIQHMYYCFTVKEEHRDYLRFIWFCNNAWNHRIVDYRMRVHVFGNTPSPNVALYCLRRAATEGEAEFGSDVRAFIERDFYVDDALKSFATESDAIRVLKRAQEMLSHSHIRLHKITSNSAAVVKEFPPEDRTTSIKDFDFSTGDVPMQRSLRT
ncbi:hypothetical protein M9458_036342, partial [Cirrhinus mrigala]